MSRRKVNAGVVGCGYFARIQHIPNICRSKRFNLRALCDLNKDLLNKSARDFKPEYATTDMKDLMNDDKLDVIFLVVAHDLHAKLVCQAAPSGKAIFIEKPMAMTMPECRKIVTAVRKYGNRLMVGYNRRFAPSMIDVKKSYDKREGRAMITYRIVADHARYGNVNKGLKKWGGDLIGETCHIFDLMRWLTGEEPVRIYSDGWWEDDTITTIRFTGDVVASITSGGIGDVRYPKERLEIFRDRGTIVNDHMLEVYDGLHHPPLSTKSHRKIKEYPCQGLYSDMVFGKGLAPFMKETPKRIPIHDRIKKATGKTETILPAPIKGHLGEIEALADAIVKGERSPVDEVDGSAATLMALKAIKSVQTARPQNVKPSEYFLK
jgi:predicted dehydrogenase